MTGVEPQSTLDGSCGCADLVEPISLRSIRREYAAPRRYYDFSCALSKRLRVQRKSLVRRK